MGRLTEQQIKSIISKASYLHHASGAARESGSREASIQEDTFSEVFEITDEMGIDSRHVIRAVTEMGGVATEEPVTLDTQDFGKAEVMGTASGELTQDMMKEIRARIEYHFNTVGKITRRKNRLVWKAAPSGLSKLISASSSPEVELKTTGPGVQIRVRQSMKTFNKLYIPSVLSAFGGFMFYAAIIFGQASNGDEAPMLVVGSLFLLASFLYTRFINSRRSKKKAKLADLTESIQQIIERDFAARAHETAFTPAESESEMSPELSISEGEDFIQEEDIQARSKSRSKA